MLREELGDLPLVQALAFELEALFLLPAGAVPDA
jgi:hypothetical protein